MNDREFSASSVAAWVMSGVAVVLLAVAVGLILGEQEMAAHALGWLAIAASIAAGVAHVRSYVIAQNRMIRLLAAGAARAATDLRPVR